MSEFQWEDPPPPAEGRYHRHGEIGRTLRGRRGQWARVAKYSTKGVAQDVAYGVRTGRFTAYEPAGDFDAAYREINGEHWVYARYVGDGPDE
ncbi:hypothetical protein [Streptomyces formicae]|uniref:Uncharacterized protein n=1 Tax=Streptomyces formicae TaxID=1616117 RepID=A0ABY3WKT1_9ACTN|nr:hypothetical protein [Streptomyces formicae]UNM12300.1 hypothetical protein J4032_12845 [Streptomyces formicae]